MSLENACKKFVSDRQNFLDAVAAHVSQEVSARIDALISSAIPRAEVSHTPVVANASKAPKAKAPQTPKAKAPKAKKALGVMSTITQIVDTTPLTAKEVQELLQVRGITPSRASVATALWTLHKRGVLTKVTPGQYVKANGG